MNYALAPSASRTRRSTLFGLVIAAHAGVFLLLVTAKTVLPQIMEIPLLVDLLDAPAALETAKPQSVSKPDPVRQPAPAKPQTPPLETSRSSVPSAEAAPVAVPDKPAAAPAEVASPARFDADYLRNPPPPYPALSRRMGEEGRVVLRVQVNTQGMADSVDVKTTSGSARLDDAAVNTVKHWKFVPAKRGDTPVASGVLVPIIFKLEQ